MEKASVMDVTQFTLENQPGSAAKKRKIESGWAVITEAIVTYGSSHLGIPWY